MGKFEFQKMVTSAFCNYLGVYKYVNNKTGEVQVRVEHCVNGRCLGLKTFSNQEAYVNWLDRLDNSLETYGDMLNLIKVIKEGE